MLQILTVLLVGLASASPVPRNCAPEAPEDKKLYSSDLRWNISFPDMMSLFDTIYSSGKRLPKRAYLDSVSGGLILPFRREGESVKMPASLVQTVAGHIQKALDRKFADAVFFADLGHSHFLIPKKKYAEEYESFSIEDQNKLYEKLLADPDALILYHTAEQLNTKVKEDTPEHLRWRYYTRNLIGENRPGGDVYVLPAVNDKANTLGEVPGYRWWGAGFNVSASNEGCFSYMDSGLEKHFDLSLFDLEPAPGTPVW